MKPKIQNRKKNNKNVNVLYFDKNESISLSEIGSEGRGKNAPAETKFGGRVIGKCTPFTHWWRNKEFGWKGSIFSYPLFRKTWFCLLTNVPYISSVPFLVAKFKNRSKKLISPGKVVPIIGENAALYSKLGIDIV